MKTATQRSVFLFDAKVKDDEVNYMWKRLTILAEKASEAFIQAAEYVGDNLLALVLVSIKN